MATTTQMGMLKLPDELLVQIAWNLSGSIKNDDSQRDLLNLAVTCKRLVEPAREELCRAMILNSSKVHILLSTLFRFPDLRDKVKSLTIETTVKHDIARPRPIPGLDAGLLHDCVCEVEAMAINAETKEAWIAGLKTSEFRTHGTLLCLLIAMLPQLEELYLGGSALYNFPIFHDIIIPRDRPDFLRTKSNWNSLNLSCIMSTLGPKLKVLGLPNNLQLVTVPDMCYGQATGISRSFPELKLLIVPFWAVEETSCQDIIPPKLETLILTSRNRPSRCWNGLLDLPFLQQNAFPSLRQVSLYRRYGEAPIAPLLQQRTTTAKLQYHEHIPRYDMRWFFDREKVSTHAWMFGDSELNELEKTRKCQLEAKWKWDELQREKAKARRMRKQSKSVEKGLWAMRYLFNEGT